MGSIVHLGGPRQQSYLTKGRPLSTWATSCHQIFIQSLELLNRAAYVVHALLHEPRRAVRPSRATNQLERCSSAKQRRFQIDLRALIHRVSLSCIRTIQATFRAVSTLTHIEGYVKPINRSRLSYSMTSTAALVPPVHLSGAEPH